MFGFWDSSWIWPENMASSSSSSTSTSARAGGGSDQPSQPFMVMTSLPAFTTRRRSQVQISRRRDRVHRRPKPRSLTRRSSCRWSTTATPLWFRWTIPTTKRISLCLLFVLQDFAFSFFFFSFFFGCVRFGGFGLCFYEFFFFPLLVPAFGCSENVEKKWEFGFWLEF